MPTPTRRCEGPQSCEAPRRFGARLLGTATACVALGRAHAMPPVGVLLGEVARSREYQAHHTPAHGLTPPKPPHVVGAVEGSKEGLGVGNVPKWSTAPLDGGPSLTNAHAPRHSGCGSMMCLRLAVLHGVTPPTRSKHERTITLGGLISGRRRHCSTLEVRCGQSNSDRIGRV